jgi:hypothetical protein
MFHYHFPQFIQPWPDVGDLCLATEQFNAPVITRQVLLKVLNAVITHLIHY